MPTPEDSWPLAPSAVGFPVTGSRIGVFIMVLGKLKLPLSKSLQRVQRLALWIFEASLRATVWVQLCGVIVGVLEILTGVVQYAEFREASKNGWGATAAKLLAQPPPAKPALPPHNCMTI